MRSAAGERDQRLACGRSTGRPGGAARWIAASAVGIQAGMHWHRAALSTGNDRNVEAAQAEAYRAPENLPLYHSLGSISSHRITSGFATPHSSQPAQLIHGIGGGPRAPSHIAATLRESRGR